MLASFLRQARNYNPRFVKETSSKSKVYWALSLQRGYIETPHIIVAKIDGGKFIRERKSSSRIDQAVISIADDIQVNKIQI